MRGIGWLDEKKLQVAKSTEDRPRYLDVPTVTSNIAFTGRRRLLIEPVVMPSLEHCGISVLTDVSSVEMGRKSRVAMRERVDTAKELISQSLVAAKEKGQPHQVLRKRHQANISPVQLAVTSAGGDVTGETSVSASALRRAGSATLLPDAPKPDSDIRMCMECMLELQYGYDPVKGPKHKHFHAQVAKFGGSMSAAGPASTHKLSLTTVATFGDRPPLESLLLR